MSNLKVEVVKIDDIKPHTNADLLEIAIIRGWQVVVKKGEFKKDDLVVYFPIDSVLPQRLSDTIGITKYLSGGRLKAVKLRGESSFGLIWDKTKASEYIWPMPFDKRNYGEGDDLTEGLGVTKWEPPLNLNDGESDVPHSCFFNYTDIQNLRNYLNIFNENEDVRITEKIHGTNSRYGWIDNTLMVGSHTMRKKESEKCKWFKPLKIYPQIQNMLKDISEKNNNANVIMYGEIFGSRIQDLTYGFKNREIDFKCFDISINGKYIDNII